MTTTDTTFVGAMVPTPVADAVRDLAKESERSTAAEIRLALKAWVETHSERQAA